MREKPANRLQNPRLPMADGHTHPPSLSVLPNWFGAWGPCPIEIGQPFLVVPPSTTPPSKPLSGPPCSDLAFVIFRFLAALRPGYRYPKESVTNRTGCYWVAFSNPFTSLGIARGPKATGQGAPKGTNKEKRVVVSFGIFHAIITHRDPMGPLPPIAKVQADPKICGWFLMPPHALFGEGPPLSELTPKGRSRGVGENNWGARSKP